jgi:hypothetical protein
MGLRGSPIFETVETPAKQKRMMRITCCQLMGPFLSRYIAYYQTSFAEARSCNP